jgi:hypothetical protein
MIMAEKSWGGAADSGMIRENNGGLFSNSI